MDSKQFKIIVELPVVYETFDYDLDRYHSEKNNTIIDSNNGYKYFAIDGLTVVFFRPAKKDVNYHIVVCELSQAQLNDMHLLYDDLLKLNPIFTFKY